MGERWFDVLVFIFPTQCVSHRSSVLVLPMVELAPGHRRLAFMEHEHQPELPYDDRSPHDGELFSLEYLYFSQSRKFREEYCFRLVSRFEQCREELKRIDDDFSSDDGQAEARQLEDTMLRTMGHWALCADPLSFQVKGRPPFDW
jgi:hypothetical protein